MHYGWACGKQKQFGPERVDDMGRLLPIYRGFTKKGEPILAELKGTGMSFFAAQLLTGDGVDSIPGLPKCGPKKAYLALKDCDTVEELFVAVGELYFDKFGLTYLQELLEQGQLLWMVAELDMDGKPVMWTIPEVLL
jgi:5'-3' exonuclease